MLYASVSLRSYGQTASQDSTQAPAMLLPGIDTLQQVVISAQRNKIAVSGNKVTLHVANSATTAASSVMDLLKNLPGVTVDQDENILFRGSSQLNIMMDGKMTYVSGKELAQMLKGISAENIAKIEMLLSPSAEFDAAGNAGILNIVTRKNLRAGYAADLRAAVSKGKYWMTNENISANFRGRQFSISGSFDFNTPHKLIKGRSSNTINENGETVRIQRDNEVAFKIRYYTYRLGADWQIAPRHQLQAGYSGYKDDFTAPKSSVIGKYDQAQHLLGTLYTTVNIIEPYYYDAGNLGYRFDIDSAGKNITADAHYISYRNYSDSRMESIYHDPEGAPAGDQQVLRSTQPGFIKIRSFKLDAELPFPAITIKAGLKYSKVTNDNQFRFDSLVAGHFVEAPSLSDHFMYTEAIKAAYVSASKKIGRISLNMGLRLEDTEASGHTVKQLVDNKWSYTRLFPSGSLEYEISEQHKINFAASRRIERPRYANLNPVRWYNDPYFMFAGNVDLKPEMGWLFTSTYTFRQKYILMLSYSKRTDFLSRRLMVEPGTNAVISQMANFDRLERFDLNFTAPFTLLHGWQVQGSAGLNYMEYPIGQLHGSSTLSQWAANLQLLQQIALPMGLKMECNAYWYSSELLGVYKHSAYFFVDCGLKRSFLEKALDVRLSLNDLFSTNHFKATSQTDYTDYTYHNRPDTRRIGLSLTYHFGGNPAVSKTRRIEEQDRL
ncbi:outer membrane beta-barrel family protein [Chitinophaga japonensis]